MSDERTRLAADLREAMALGLRDLDDVAPLCAEVARHFKAFDAFLGQVAGLSPSFSTRR